MRFGPVRTLLLLMVLAAGGLGWLWFDEAGNVRNVRWVAPAPMAAGIASKTVAPTAGSTAANPAQFLAVLERPVFAPDRRPPPPPAPPTPPPPPDPMANIQILGVFSGANGGVIARVDGKPRRVRMNESVGSWTLKSIEGRDITFAQGGEKRQLRLLYSNLGVAAVQAPAASAAQASGGQAPSAMAAQQSQQEENRERLRRRNEIRAARGLPLITE